jgi:hypothetical protein
MAELSQFIVLKRKGRWSVKGADVDQTFADQLAAIKAGIELANEAGKNGKASVVLFGVSKTRFKTIWTFGVDSYPSNPSGLCEMGTGSSTKTSIASRRRSRTSSLTTTA